MPPALHGQGPATEIGSSLKLHRPGDWKRLRNYSGWEGNLSNKVGNVTSLRKTDDARSVSANFAHSA